MVSIFFIMFNPSNGIIIWFLYLITFFREFKEAWRGNYSLGFEFSRERRNSFPPSLPLCL